MNKSDKKLSEASGSILAVVLETNVGISQLKRNNCQQRLTLDLAKKKKNVSNCFSVDMVIVVCYLGNFYCFYFFC